MNATELEADFSKRTMSNLITEVVYVILAAAIGLLMVPYYIGELGMSAYAVVPLATSVTSYVMIVADAFCSSVNRYFIVALKRDSREEVSVVFGTSMFSVLRICAVVMPLTALLAYLSPMFFDISGSSYGSVRLLFLMVLWAALVVAVGSCFNNALVAKNKLYSINMARISYLVVQVVLIVALFLFDTPRLEFIGLAYLLASLFYLVLSYILMRSDFPWLKLSFRVRDRTYLKEMDRLSVWSIVNRLGSLMSIQASLIVANVCLGAYSEGSFSLVTSLVSMVGTACLAITNVFNPFLFKHYASQDRPSMVNTCVTGARFLSLILAFPLAFLCVFSPEILTAWVGEEFVFLEGIIWVMVTFLMMQSVMSVLDVVPTITLDIRGMAIITVMFGALNVILAVMFCSFTDLGLMGVAVAWTVSISLRSCIAIPFYVAGTLDAQVKRFFVPQAVGLLLFAVLSVIMISVSHFLEVPSNLFVLGIVFLVSYAVYVPLAFRAVFRKDDRIRVLDLMPARLSALIGRFI